MQYTISDIPPFEISRGFTARMFHSEHMTVAFVTVEEGATLPEHAHVHEQITNLLEGRFDITIGGKTFHLEAGDSVVIPSNVPHYGKAITASRLMDVFNPVREDFRKGEVAYAIR